MWNTDFIQFARLLSEINSVGLEDKQIKKIADNMNLMPKEVVSILNNASTKLEELLPILNKGSPISEDDASEELAERGSVEGVVEVEMDEIMGYLSPEAIELFCDELGARTTNMPIANIDYKLICAQGDNIYLKIKATMAEEEAEEEIEAEVE